MKLPSSNSPSTAASRTLYAFRADGRLYGAEVLQIQEVRPCPPITEVPQAPKVVRGLVNVRSHIYLAIDMRALIGSRQQTINAGCRMVIIKAGIASDLGLIVEHDGDIVHVHPDQIEAPPRSAESESLGALFPRVCRMDQELMTLIDLSAVASLVLAHYESTHRIVASTSAIASHSLETRP